MDFDTVRMNAQSQQAAAQQPQLVRDTNSTVPFFPEYRDPPPSGAPSNWVYPASFIDRWN
jgi:hypothetical protein